MKNLEKIIKNKEYHTAGSLGSADAAPRMTECERSALTCHSGPDPESHEILNRATLVQNDGVYQYGRSMVEMLGVLAIIGVLSVGGIAGYTSAMRQYKANEIVNATSMLYMMGASQNQGNVDKQMLYSGALGTVPSGVSEITYNADKTITLAFTDTDICPLAKNKLGDKTTGECPTLSVSFGEVTTTVENIFDNFLDKNCTTENCYTVQHDRNGKIFFCQVLSCNNGKWEWEADEYESNTYGVIHPECLKHPACNSL